jgi:hypothetical protein
LWVQNVRFPAAQDRRLLEALWPYGASFGLEVTPEPGALAVSIAAGKAAVLTANDTGVVVCPSTDTESLTIPAPPASGTRIDQVVVHPRATDIDGSSYNDFIFEVIEGGSAPMGTLALAEVSVAAGAITIQSGDITDLRPGGLAVAEGGGGGGLPSNLTIGTSPPQSPAIGDIWIDTTIAP